jgi:hypothetical protein
MKRVLFILIILIYSTLSVAGPFTREQVKVIEALDGNLKTLFEQTYATFEKAEKAVGKNVLMIHPSHLILNQKEDMYLLASRDLQPEMAKKGNHRLLMI